MIEPREQAHVIVKTDEFVATTFWGILALLAGSAITAGLASRGLYQDGAYYLIRMAERDWFYLVDPARTTVQILRQMPVVLLMRTSGLSLQAYGTVFSLAMLLLPVLLAIPCWFIPPRGLRGYAIFPVFSLLLGLFTQSIEAVGEAAIATAFYWVMLFLLVFRTRGAVTQIAFVALCAAACFLHEGAALLTTVLLAGCGCRLFASTTAQDRIFLCVSVLVLTAVLTYQIDWIVHPRVPGQSSTAFQALTSFGFLARNGRINLTVIPALAACFVLTIMWARQNRAAPPEGARRVWWPVAGFAAIGAVAAFLPWTCEACIAPTAQALSRYNALFSGLGLGFLMLYCHMAGIRPSQWTNPPALAVISILAVTQVSADAAATIRWKAYVADFAARIATTTGLLPWASTVESGDRIRDENWQAFSAGWVVPMLSIILAPGGKVGAIIDYPADAWRSIEPHQVDALPKIRGVDYASYRRALADDLRGGRSSNETAR